MFFGIILIIVGLALEFIGNAFTTHESWLSLVGAGFLKLFARIGGILAILIGIFLMFN